VLKHADMDLKDIIQVRLYSVDVDQTQQHFDVIASQFAKAGISPPMTFVGVTRLAIPELLFEIEAIAAS